MTIKEAILKSLEDLVIPVYNNEVYNHIDYIHQAWKDAYFEVDPQYSDHKLESGTAIKRKSASKQFEEDYRQLLDFKKQQQEDMIFYLGKTPEEEVKARNPLAYKAYKLLDEATVNKLEYNVKKIQKAIIVKKNSSVEVKLLKLLAQTFRINERYSNEYIKSELQDIYNNLNIRNKNGEIEKANAKQLGNKGWFEIKDCKIPTSKSKPLNGYIIIRQQFGLKMAA